MAQLNSQIFSVTNVLSFRLILPKFAFITSKSIKANLILNSYHTEDIKPSHGIQIENFIIKKILTPATYVKATQEDKKHEVILAPILTHFNNTYLSEEISVIMQMPSYRRS